MRTRLMKNWFGRHGGFARQMNISAIANILARIFLLFLFTMVLIVLTAKDEVNKSPTPPMYNSPLQQNTENKRHSLLHRVAENSYETDE